MSSEPLKASRNTSLAGAELEPLAPRSKSRSFDKAPEGAIGRRIVWSVWAALAVAAFGYVIHFGVNVPFWDDWNMVDFLTGTRPVTLQWLWSPYGGHRLPLPRLILVGLYKVSGTDFRAGMLFTVTVLAAAAAALIWASARMRGGKVSMTDAVFPLLLLHWGHFQNLLWSWQLGFGLAVALTCTVLAVIAAYGISSVPKAVVVLAALLVVILPISDVPAMVYAPALACWLTATGVIAYRDHRRRYAAVLWLAATLALILVVLYFRGYPHQDVPLVPRSAAHWRALLRTSVRFVTGGLGPTVKELFPPARAAAAVVVIATAAAVGWAALRRDALPYRAFALLFFYGGAACLVVTFAAGRLDSEFQSRYFTLAAPVWCAAFLSWRLCFRPRLARSAELGLLVAVLIAMPLNFRAGLCYARDYHARMERFRSDMVAGLSPAELVARHVESLHPCPWWGFPDVGVQLDQVTSPGMEFPVMQAVSFHEWMEANLRKLHAARIDGFGSMRTDDPPVHDIVPVPSNGFEIARATSSSGTSTSENADAAVLFTPTQSVYVAGVRVRRPAQWVSSSVTDSAPQWVQVLWRLPGETRYKASHHYVFLWDSQKTEQIVWIFQTVDQIAFHTGNSDVQRQLNPDNLPITVLLPAQ